MADAFDENSIVKRILTGESAAFGGLVDRYEKKAYQYASNFFGNEEEAADAVIDIFSEVYRSLTIRMDVPLYIWIYRIIVRVCEERQHRRRNVAHYLWEPFHKENQPPELAKGIQTQLLRLPRQQREVLLLHDLCSMSDKETSLIMGIEGNTVHLRLSRARKNLRDMLVRQNAFERTETPQGSKDCQQYRELCSGYVDEQITEASKTRLLDHIQTCPACSLYLNDLTLIGRTLQHMAENNPPKELREHIIDRVKKQPETARKKHRRLIALPMVGIAGVMVLLFVLLGTGVIGELIVNSTPAHTQTVQNAGSANSATTELLQNLRIPDAVAANSYAFVIAAAGNTDFPEFSAAVTLLVGDEGSGVEYYAVNNDISLVQQLIDGLSSIGYETETVTNSRIVISTTAPEGLFIVLHTPK